MFIKYMKKLMLYIAFLVSVTFIFAGEIRDKTERIIASKIDGDIKINSYKLTLKDLSNSIKYKAESYVKQKFYGKYIYYYEIEKNDEIISYAILDNVKGKVKPITYLVIFNKDFSINYVEIIKYREEHGGTVQNSDWLAQFKKKSILDEPELNNNIDGISGATISVKSLVKGIRRNLFLINNLSENERNSLITIK